MPLNMCVKKYEPAGIYIHIPFCIRKCPYCDFYSVTDLSLQDAFVRALKQEFFLNRQPDRVFDTVYLGGGTPSTLPPDAVGQLLESAHHAFCITKDAEITIEVNPGTVNEKKLTDLRSAGINRLNIGVQSFQDENLKFLGRIHSAGDASRIIRQAREAGFENVGLDLIYGLPDQSDSSWRSDLRRAMELEPEHLSCYMLTYESGTPLDISRKKGIVHPLSEGRSATLFETTMEVADAGGYEHYEISNYARFPAARSRHNQKYWAFVPYLGFGPAAHSYMDARRYWNHRNISDYLSDLGRGKRPVGGEEQLNREQQIMETLYLGLRKTEGIDIPSFDRNYGVCFNQLYGKVIAQLKELGCIEIDASRCRLTRKGMLFLDSIAAMLI